MRKRRVIPAKKGLRGEFSSPASQRGLKDQAVHQFQIAAAECGRNTQVRAHHAELKTLATGS
jgi:hypothetical protein